MKPSTRTPRAMGNHWCRYLEKVVPSPYGPRLQWWFPASMSYWRTGDVEDCHPAAARLQRWGACLKRLLHLKRGSNGEVAYRQVSIMVFWLITMQA